MSNTFIRIEKGQYTINGKLTEMGGHIFRMVEPFKMGTKRGYVTVDAKPIPGLPDRNIFILCESENDYTLLDGWHDPDQKETDEELLTRMNRKFELLGKITLSAKKGDVRSVIVKGPPGLGKSHIVEETLAKYDTLPLLGQHIRVPYEIVKGEISALGLFCILWKYKDKNNVVVFDDCDSVLFDDTSLNILKAALDSKKRRRISWNTDSKKLEGEGIPNTFEFEGSAIFITNVDFRAVRSQRLREHLMALESRSHYIDMGLSSKREKLLRMRWVIDHTTMMEENGITELDRVNDIFDWVEMNQDTVRELSLRTVVKAAQLNLIDPEGWRELADTTLVREELGAGR